MRSIQRHYRWYPRMITSWLSNTVIRQCCSRPGYPCLSFVILVAGLLVFTGRPKFIFQPRLHIPWLTDVQLVQPLNCITVDNQPQWPSSVLPDSRSSYDDHLTVVIVTARSQFKGLPLTLAALVCHLDSRQLSQIIILVPPQDVFLLERYFSGETADHWPWSISIMPDDRVMKHIHTHSYRLQMMFKLAVAQLIKTEYYMLLDSDCVAVWPIHVEQLLWRPTTQTSKKPVFRALYQLEERSDNKEWWPESEQLLQIKPNTCASTHPSSATIGVTPAILSKSIALRTMCRLQMLYGDRSFLNKLANWALWRTPFGRMWTEYTFYYLTARCTHTFDIYHFHRANASSVPPLNLYGLSMWWLTDWKSFTRRQLLESVAVGLRWRRKEIEEADGAPILDSSAMTHNLFTVLQSRLHINSIFHNLFYPMFIEHLKQRYGTQQIVKVLDDMAQQLTEQ